VQFVECLDEQFVLRFDGGRAYGEAFVPEEERHMPSHAGLIQLQIQLIQISADRGKKSKVKSLLREY
jgi:hypothetical protein